MLSTARRGIQYPNPDRSDRPDVPAHLGILASFLDVDVVYHSGLDSARTAQAHQTNGGAFWWSTDTNVMWYDDGTTWHALGSAPLNSPVFTGTPTAPNPAPGDNSNQIATTEFVNSFFPTGAVMAYAGGTAPNGWLICDGSAISRSTYSNLFAILATTYGIGDGSTTFNIPDVRGRVPVGLNNATFNTLGKTGGEETHVTTITEMPAHNHTESAVSAGTPAGTVTVANASTLTTSTESASHTHTYQEAIGAAQTAGSGAGMDATTPVQTGPPSTTHTHTVPAHGHTATFAGTALGTHSHTIANTGGGAAHNNIQPYIVLNYIIKY